jgi:hypothetical protein
MNTPLEFQMFIRGFVNLQTKLIGSFMDAFPQVTDWLLLREVPKSGELIVDAEPWTFRRHGSGVQFENARGVTVDTHRALPDPGIFDAWRLVQYFESLGVSIGFPIEEAAVEARLADLSKSGHIRPVGKEASYRFAV